MQKKKSIKKGEKNKNAKDKNAKDKNAKDKNAKDKNTKDKNAKDKNAKDIKTQKNDILSDDEDVNLETFDNNNLYNDDSFYNDDNFKDYDNIKYKIYNPDTFTNITHREINIVPRSERRTSDIITQYEYTEVTSIRGKQIEDGSKIFIDIKNLSDPVKIAEREIVEKKCPLSIRRMLCDEYAEVWEVNEMIIPY